ncbi:serine/arginine repetitive matrix protein 1-like [Iris pallida]|uniref:Serine/arginine repetitive matrix protein 1-like n=1 Tax=Iris pallida TaxID=29817 RepID=A0AAX6FT76_IRIPA|nr:serine/arginine repetitive matrix protein 1-like [Iris pallida]
MEKNTGKFMKELWGLLLSAQSNVSGVPQQFLDAKEEETRKKKVETDRIASEIQKRREKEGREPERGRKSRFEGEADISRSVKDAPDLVTRNSKARSSSLQPEEEREVGGQHDSRAVNGRSGSPKLRDRSPSPFRRTVSPTGSNKRSISRSRSDSGKDRRSRSVSVPSQSQRRSASLERRYQSPTRRSLSPERRYKSPRRSISPRRRYSPRITRSPSRRRSPRLRRRSTSRSRHRSPSPYRQRSPRARQRSSPSVRRRSPISRRRSPSPLRHRSPSPLRRKSPSPLPRRSPTPVRRRSPSPARHRSPVRARRRSPSPLRRRSPMRRRSPSPWRRSPIYRSPNHRRRSPIRSPKRHPTDSQYSRKQRKRSGSPYRSRSPLNQARRSLSVERDSRIDGHATRHRDEHTSRRELEKRSPVDHGLNRKINEHAGSGHKASETAYRKVPISLRSPQRDVGNQSEDCGKVPAAITEGSPRQLESPVNVRKTTPRTNISLRSPILSKSPSRKTRIRSPLHESPRTSRDEEQTGHAREDSHHRIDSSHKRNKYSPGELGLKKSNIDDLGPGRYPTDRVIANHQSSAARGRSVHLEKNSQRSDVDLPERNVQQESYSSDDIKYGPVSVREERDSQGNVHDRQRSCKLHPKNASSLEERAHNEKEAGDGVNAGKIPRPRNEEHREPHQDTESIRRSKRKADKRNRHDSKDSDSEETGSDKNQIMEKRRHKKSDKRKRDSDDSSSSDSQVDDRKEAKRRRRDEKRLRKEERRRRREEKHRKKLERRASKEKVKSVDMFNPPSDFEKNHNNSDDSDVAGTRKNIHPSDAEETESEQKKLEIELRKKALESLRAKKAITEVD